MDTCNHGFQYPPLDEARCEIRLFRLRFHTENASGYQEGKLDYGHEVTTDTKDLVGEIRAVSLDAGQDFRALSYCWGTDHPDYMIQINGQGFFVRQNLHDFLKLTRELHDSAWIFIDAICINQHDLGEKSSQVALMGDVYRTATEVKAWLGFPSSSMHRLVLEAWQDLSGTTLERHTTSHVQESLTTISVALGSCGYWSRLWVVQETLLATSLVIQYGRLTFEWKALKRVLDKDSHFHGFVEEFNPQWAFRQVARGRKDGIVLWRMLMMKALLRQKERYKGKVLQLADPLTNFAYQKCTDRRDKIFGLRSLSVSCVDPDYTMAISELYVRTLVEARLQQQMADVIKTQGHQERPASDLILNLRAMVDRASSHSPALSEFYVALDGAFGWSMRSSTLALIFQEATGALRSHLLYAGWVLPVEQRTRVPRPLRRLLRILDQATKLRSIHILYQVTRLQLHRQRSKNSFMSMPDDSTDTRTYQEWVKFVKGVVDDVVWRMSTKEYVEDFTSRQRELDFIEDQRKQSIAGARNDVGQDRSYYPRMQSWSDNAVSATVKS